MGKYRILYKLVSSEKEMKYEEKLAARMFNDIHSEYSLESGAYAVYIEGQYDTEKDCRHKMAEIKQRKPHINIFLQYKERWE